MPCPNKIPRQYSSGVFDLARYSSLELILSRGCVGRCKYCKIYEGGVQYVPVAGIKKELSYVLKRAARLRTISVRTFDMFYEKSRCLPYLELFRDVSDRKGIGFCFDIGITSVNRDNIPLLKACDSPLFTLDIGLQSVAPQVLEFANRPPLDRKSLEEKLRLIRAHAPRAKCVLGIIRGLPSDTLTGYRNTLDAVLSHCDTFDYAVNHIRIMPRTMFHRQKKDLKIRTADKYPYFGISCFSYTKNDMKEMIRLTDTTAFVLDLTFFHRTIRKALIELGTGLKNTGNPYLFVFDSFGSHLAKKDYFKRTLPPFGEYRDVFINEARSRHENGFKTNLYREFLRFRKRIKP